jgi:hypothetical protein
LRNGFEHISTLYYDNTTTGASTEADDGTKESHNIGLCTDAIADTNPSYTIISYGGTAQQ